MDREALIRLRWPIALVAVVAILCGTAWLFYRSTLDVARDSARGTFDAAASLAEGLRSEQLTTSFLAAIPEVASAGAGRLEVATARTTETLTRTDERKLLWDLVSLGKTVAEVRVPVTYRYHLRLDDPWRLEISGQSCIVHAPALRPSLPPAIHTQGLERRTEEGWLRFDAQAQLSQLERSVTPILSRYASDPRHLDMVRDKARITTSRFVRDWLLSEDQWRQDRFRVVTVIFADEEEALLGDLPSLALHE